MNGVCNKIRMFRELKNYTQSYVTDQLNVSQNTYSKIESGVIRLTLERLGAISEILEAPIEEFLRSDSQILNFENNSIEKFCAHVENLHEVNRELIENTIEILREQIENLKSENQKLTNHLMGKF